MERITISVNEENAPMECFSAEEVIVKLSELSNSIEIEDAPVTAIVNSNGNELILGLGIDPTFLCIQIYPCDGEYYTSVGGEKPGKEIMSYGAGQDSYWDSENLIPFKKALKAVTFFIDNEKLFSEVKWKNWDGKFV